MSVKFGLLVVTIGVLAATQGQAQTTTVPSNSAADQEGANLSSKLSKSGGVIAPSSSVDPGMKVPAPVPAPNSTPVIPPSATGGNTAK